MYSFWQERLGKTLLDACTKHWESPSEMMLRLHQYQGVIQKRSEAFLEVFLKSLLWNQMEKGFEVCGRRLALVAKHYEGEGQEERLIAVPEATRSGDVVYWTLQEGDRTPSSGSMLIVLRPCRVEISKYQQLKISILPRDFDTKGAIS
jgi:hypothetical protein